MTTLELGRLEDVSPKKEGVGKSMNEIATFFGAEVLSSALVT